MATMNNIRFEEKEFHTWLHTTDFTGALGLTIKFYVKDENVAAFKEGMKKNKAHSLSEKGCRMYKVNSDYKDASVFWVVEEWDSVADLKAHCTSEAYVKSSSAMLSLMKDPPCHIGLYKLE